MKRVLHNGKGAIFDLDGTLLDTLDDLAATGNYVLEKFGFSPLPIDGFRYYVGSGMRNMLRMALVASQQRSKKNDIIDEGLVLNMTESAVSYYMDNWHNHTRLYVGVDKMLSGLAARGIPFAVCSNKGDAFVKKTVRHFFPDLPFIDTIGQSDDNPLKPDPAGALRLAGMMGLKPQDVVFIGDTKIDMQTADRAGMFSVGVSWGFRSKDELLAHGARLIVNEPEELLRCFG